MYGNSTASPCTLVQGLHPLRSPGTTTKWQVLHIPANLAHAPLLRKQHKPGGIILQPAHGGRSRKHALIYNPPAEPTVFRMGRGPRLDDRGLGYYERPEHLRTNRTKTNARARPGGAYA